MMPRKIMCVLFAAVVCGVFIGRGMVQGQIPQSTETIMYQLMLEEQIENRVEKVLGAYFNTEHISAMVKINLSSRHLVMNAIKERVELQKWDKRSEYVLPGIPAANKMTKKEPFQEDIKQHDIETISAFVFIGREISQQQRQEAKTMVNSVLGINPENSDAVVITTYQPVEDKKSQEEYAAGSGKAWADIPRLAEGIAAVFLIILLIFLFGPVRKFFFGLNENMRRLAEGFMMGGGAQEARGEFEGIEVKTRIQDHEGVKSGEKPADDELFSFVTENTLNQLKNIFQDESAEKSAAVLQMIPLTFAQAVLNNMDEKKRFEIIKQFEKISYEEPDYVNHVNQELQARIKKEFGGAARLGRLIQGLDDDKRIDALNYLGTKNAKFAEDVRDHLVYFEDVIKYDEADVRRIFRAVGIVQFAKLLKQCSDEVIQKFYDKLGSVISDMLKEHLAILPPASDTAQARMLLVQVIERLVRDGHIPSLRKIKMKEVSE